MSDTLPREIAAEWFARLLEMHALAVEQGVHISIGVGGHPQARPSIAFIASDHFPSLLPDLSADREWGRNEDGTHLAYEINGCSVATSDQRAASRAVPS